MRNITCLIALFCLFTIQSFSQGTLRGKIIDSASKGPLGLATITVFKASDTALITYRLSAPESGEFKVPGLPLDVNCRVVISFSGYAIFRQEFTIPANQSTFDIGTITMMPDSKSLDEVLVIAERPPVVVKKDTIEFNASAFKTLPNALVEDLLKKLPGVQVDRDGNITVNGRPVNRILVDGKTFFGDDPKMATRNLPANVIDKVQVTDDKEELMRNGDDNINNVGKVVNITLKKGVKKGWFGKVYGGAGSNSRYEAGGIANIYRDTLQVSVLGYINNLNRPGFSYGELMQTAGLERNRSNMSGSSTSIWSNSGGSGISINGINFGGVQQNGGIATSRGAGFNLNHAPNKKRSFFAQYFFGNVVVDRRNYTDASQFSNDTIINNKTIVTGDVINNSHNIGIGARLKPDSVTNILINANYSIGLQDENRFSDINSENNKIGQLSYGDIMQDNLANTYYYKHAVAITKLSRTKAGRRFNFNHNLDINNRYNDYTTESDIRFLYPNAFDSAYGQLRKERVPRTDGSASFNFSEPLTKKITFRVNGRYDFSKLNNNINTFNKDGNEYKLFNPALSSEFERISNRIYFSPAIEFKWKSFTIAPAIRGIFQRVNNDFASLSDPIKQSINNISPALSISWKQLNFNYNRDISLPGYNYLLPVTDNTNPYYIAKGNTDLAPIQRHSFSLNGWFNDPKRNLNVGGWMSANYTENDVIQSIVIDDKGIQTTTPVNADGTKSYSMNFNINKQYKNKQKFIFSWNTGNWFNYTHSKMLFNNETSWQTTVNYNHWFGVNLNWNDKVEWNESYSIGNNFTNYTNPTFKKLSVTVHNWDNELIVRWPKHVIWETRAGYIYNSSVPKGLPKEVITWNAAINFTFLKNEAGVLKLGIYDILDRTANVWVSANRNQISTFQTNVLGQYFLATFTYNVRAAGASKKVGGSRLFFF